MEIFTDNDDERKLHFMAEIGRNLKLDRVLVFSIKIFIENIYKICSLKHIVP